MIAKERIEKQPGDPGKQDRAQGEKNVAHRSFGERHDSLTMVAAP